MLHPNITLPELWQDIDRTANTRCNRDAGNLNKAKNKYALKLETDKRKNHGPYSTSTLTTDKTKKETNHTNRNVFISHWGLYCPHVHTLPVTEKSHFK